MDNQTPVLSYGTEQLRPISPYPVYVCVLLSLIPEGALIAENFAHGADGPLMLVCAGAVILVPNLFISVYLIFKHRERSALFYLSVFACLLNIVNGFWLFRGLLSLHS